MFGSCVESVQEGVWWVDSDGRDETEPAVPESGVLLCGGCRAGVCLGS